VGGHRRIATALFERYGERPKLLAALLELDHDAANGGIHSTRAYAEVWQIRRSTVCELVRAYVAHVKALHAPRVIGRDRRQRALFLPYDGAGGTGTASGTTRPRRNPNGIGLVVKNGNHLGSETGTSPSLLRREEEDHQSAQAREPEGRSRAESVAYFRRFAAARRALIRDGERYPMPEQIKARAALLTEDQVDEILAEHRKEVGERAGEDRKARTTEALRHEGRRR